MLSIKTSVSCALQVITMNQLLPIFLITSETITTSVLQKISSVLDYWYIIITASVILIMSDTKEPHYISIMY